MAVSSTTNRSSHTGNGSVSQYAYTFKIFSGADLLVTVTDDSSVETELTLTTDYTVNDAGEATGGTIDLVSSGQAWLTAGGNLKSGYGIVIRRVRDIKQETEFRNQGDYYAQGHEDEFDKQIMIDQQQQDELDRTVKNAETVTSSDFNPVLPSDLAGAQSKAPITNSAGNGWADASDWPSATAISGASASATAASSSADEAEEWATKTDGIVESTDYSSKAWSIGGTNVTETASRGAAKEWATKTDNPVDTSEFSAKEYAQGSQASTGGSAKNWAQETGNDVTGASAGEMSAKEWALGTLGRGVSGEGSSKDWATYTSGTVDDTEYSSKEWATGTQTRGVASSGSAKDWATYTGGTVDDAEYSAKYYSQQAATNALTSLFRDTVFYTNADSPVTLTASDLGKFIVCDCTSGAISITLPDIAALSTVEGGIAFKKSDATSNAVTINRASTDTIDGSTSYTLDTENAGVILASHYDTSPDTWTSAAFGPSAGGGGGSAVTLHNDSGTAPLEETVSDAKVWTFTDGGSEKLFAFIKVPEGYVSGRQVFMYLHTFSQSGTTSTQLISATTTLVEDDITSTTNQESSTNTATAAGGNNQIVKHSINLTDASGQVNSVAVAASDILKVELSRGTDSDTGDIHLVPGSVEVTFS